MKYFRSACVFLIPGLFRGIAAWAAEPPAEKVEYCIALHGGAHSVENRFTGEEEAQCRQSLARALEVGRKVLAENGAALDAVEKTIRAMEDDPLFNAGRGAVFNDLGKHELDASIMDGSARQAGGVAIVATVKNPISLARLVMIETPHILLSGEGAEKFADEMRGRPSIERVPNSYFDTESRRKKWLELREKEAKKTTAMLPALHPSTVGCVALDKSGNLAAGTSTGGMNNKKWGRVGDSPIVGAGTYADNATCAVSGTGIGEEFIRNSSAFHVSALMAYKQFTVDEAVRHVLEKVMKPGTGGIIALDRTGRVSMRYTTFGMARAVADSTGKIEIEVSK
ncbi:MAG: isoaspartyl peptidase/L-asparaginase [Pirellulales bacterium]|nr:isoaspartyl peptidase/L-asparaginase [Pirellulales bacterium]